MSLYFLKPDNFTPLTRTPWAGDKIHSLKSDHVENCPTRIGESWEFSCDPAMVSKLKDSHQEITECLQKPTDVLIKLLHASSSLSLQIHPHDDDPQLKEDECGKPEAWYVIDSDPGCGIYLGFKENYSKDSLPELLKNAQNDECLHFIETKPGDYFEILPGVPHAIGPGVLLLEPQRVRSGKSGKTYRMWDWNRKYNTDGVVDEVNGNPRELHLSQALSCLSMDDISGKSIELQCRKKANMNQEDSMSIQAFPANEDFQLTVLNFKDEKEYSIDFCQKLAVITVFDGKLVVEDQTVSKGQSFVVENQELKITGFAGLHCSIVIDEPSSSL